MTAYRIEHHWMLVVVCYSDVMLMYCLCGFGGLFIVLSCVYYFMEVICTVETSAVLKNT